MQQVTTFFLHYLQQNTVKMLQMDISVNFNLITIIVMHTLLFYNIIYPTPHLNTPNLVFKLYEEFIYIYLYASEIYYILQKKHYRYLWAQYLFGCHEKFIHYQRYANKY